MGNRHIYIHACVDRDLWSEYLDLANVRAPVIYSAGSNYMPVLAVPCGHLVQGPNNCMRASKKSGAWRTHDHLARSLYIGQHGTPNYGRSDQPDGWR